MQNKLIIDGNEANHVLSIRTTSAIIDAMRERAFEKNVSMNILINKAMLAETRRWKKLKNPK